MTTSQATLIRWEPSRLSHHSENGYTGQIKQVLWTVGWQGGKGDAAKYYLVCELPGIKKKVFGPSMEALKQRAEHQLLVFKELLDGTYEPKEKGPLS
jgi:hypothetical protein